MGEIAAVAETNLEAEDGCPLLRVYFKDNWIEILRGDDPQVEKFLKERGYD